MTNEEKEIIKSLIKGDKECLEVELRVNPNNKEDIEHWEKEIKTLEKLSNLYEKEKVRADKLEIEYSQLLTKIDEYEAISIPTSKIEEKIEELKEMNLDCDTFGSMRDYAVLILQELMEEK